MVALPLLPGGPIIVRDVLELIRVSGWRGAFELAAHSTRLRRSTRECVIVMGLTALEKVGLNGALLSPAGLDLDAHPELDRHSLRAVCEYLFEVGVLEETGDGVYRARRRERFRARLEVMYGYYAYHQPLYALDRLISGDWRYGREVARDDRYDAMASADLTSKFSYQFSAELLAKRPFERLVDLGSGTGGYCAYLADRFPRARFWGIDVAADAIAEGRARGHESERLMLRVGDITDLAPLHLDLERIDVFSLMFVLHEFSDQEIWRILHQVRAVEPAARVLLTELIGKPSRQVRKERRRIFPELKIVHQLSHQVLRTPEEWVELFGRAGLRADAERRHALTNHVALLFAPAT